MSCCVPPSFEQHARVTWAFSRHTIRQTPPQIAATRDEAEGPATSTEQIRKTQERDKKDPSRTHPAHGLLGLPGEALSPVTVWGLQGPGTFASNLSAGSLDMSCSKCSVFGPAHRQHSMSGWTAYWLLSSVHQKFTHSSSGSMENALALHLPTSAQERARKCRQCTR